MPPKKGKKMALNDFLVDETLGSWADEMDNLPAAPALRTEEERFRDRDGRRDFSPRDRDSGFSSRESGFPPREELPLPTKPPFIAFVGNLAFDIYEDPIAEFFAPAAVKDIKIIKDRDEKPKGFGYVEFETLDGLKDALTRSGGQLAGRMCRVSVAEPPKERSGGFGDDDRFEGPWRRQGPLPPLPGPGPSEGPRRSTMGFGARDAPPGEAAPPSLADTTSDWRRAARPPPAPERPTAPPRRPSGPTSESNHPALNEDKWTIGSKFKPSAPVDAPPQERRSLFGGNRPDAVAPGSNPEEVSDWRSAPRRSVSQAGSTRGSPTTSTPPTPQGGRRKLELLPRGTATPTTESPLASPRSASTPSSKANPFGAAKPIDVSGREKEVEERLEQERATRAVSASKEKERSSPFSSMRSLPPSKSDHRVGRESIPTSPKAAAASVDTSSHPPPAAPRAVFNASAAVRRPMTSFAAAASSSGGGTIDPALLTIKPPSTEKSGDVRADSKPDEGVEKITEQVAEISV